MRKAITAIRATTIALGMVVPGYGIVNHLPEKSLIAGNRVEHIERKHESLNQVLGADTEQLASFPYWNHIGMVGMGSGIYLGEGKVLTSAHVGCFPFRMQDGSVYQPFYASWRILKNTDGTQSDLAVFSVQFAPTSSLAQLDALPIASAHEDRPVLLVGTGYTQGENPIRLASQGRSLAVLGYHVRPQRSIAWGLNRTAHNLDAPVATGGHSSTVCFTTRFERNEFAGQAAEGDSGGAGFSYNRELKRWELSGCIIAVTQQQPSVTFGARTFLGDLSFYAPQLTGGDGPLARRPGTKTGDAIQARPASIR